MVVEQCTFQLHTSEARVYRIDISSFRVISIVSAFPVPVALFIIYRKVHTQRNDNAQWERKTFEDKQKCEIKIE